MPPKTTEIYLNLFSLHEIKKNQYKSKYNRVHTALKCKTGDNNQTILTEKNLQVSDLSEIKSHHYIIGNIKTSIRRKVKMSPKQDALTLEFFYCK